MKRISTFLVAALLIIAGIPGQTQAQISLTSGMIYNQDFNGYTGLAAATLPAGWTIGGIFSYRGQGPGTNNAGGSWAYGIGADRSLGYLGSATSPNIMYNVNFTNNTGAVITQLSISYDFEQWRFAGGNTNGWTVSGLGALSVTSLAGLNTTSALSGPTGTCVTTPKSLTLTGLNIAPGATFGIRWICSDGAGSDNGIAIDNFHMVMPCTPTAHTTDTTLCPGTAFSWNGNTYTTAQTLVDTFTNSTGCDSFATVHLSYYAPITHSFADTICFGATYSWGTQTPNATGAYTQVFSAAAGCDSTVTLNLFERPQITHSFADTICFGATYAWGTQNQSATGTYTQTFTAATGCDSIVTLNLFKRPQITHNFADTICFGATYAWGTQNQNATGTYTQTFTAATGCDSIVTLNLFERPQITHSFADTICFGATYAWGTQNQNATGTYTQTFTAATGCDSIVTLNLFERPQITHNFADTICFGATYVWGAQSLNTIGAYTQIFTSFTGCDSIVTLNLFERPQITHSFADTICFGATYAWGTQNQNATGTYTQTFTAATGCDSIVTLNLFERPQITHNFADTICFGATYAWGTQNQNATGTYTQTFTATTGCDSIVTLNLFERPQITHSFADTICFGATYAWGTQNQNATGTYTQTFTAATGCDSIVTLNLFERSQITHSFADTICFGATYTWGTQSLNTTGAYTQTFTSFTGCDSIVTLNLFERPQIIHAATATICSGDFYTLGTQILTTAGVYTEIFTAASGCDSTVTLTLGVNPTIVNTVSHSICYGTSYSWGSQVLNTTGTYTQTFPSSGTCDSIVTLNLTVMPQITNSVSLSICNGTTYTFGPQTLNTTGNYVQAFTAANGCDSTVTLALTVKPAITHAATAYICAGTSYAFGSQALNASGTYTQAFTAADGCDSTVTLTLTVSPGATASVTDTAACGVVQFENGSYFNSTVLHDTLFNTQGCDSIYRTINITVHNNTPAQLTIDTAGCGFVSFEGSIYYQSTTLQHMYTNVYGCDSLARTVYVTVMQAHSDTTRAAICQGATYEFYSQTFTTEGTYKVTLPDPQGRCDYDFILVLKVNALPVAALEDPGTRARCIGDTVELQAKGEYAYTWFNATGAMLGTGDHMNVYLHDGSNSFTIKANDDNGCTDTTSITLAAQPCCSIGLPNAFSPNGDGMNDLFRPVTNGHPAEYVLQVFNRWGQLVYKSFNIDEGWDGTISGKPAAIDTYYYRISGKCVSGEAWNKKGELTLIR